MEESEAGVSQPCSGWLVSIWATWILVTGTYLAFFAVSFLIDHQGFHSNDSMASYVTRIIGMFVPFGVWNGFAAIFGLLRPFATPILRVLALPAALVLMFFADRLAKRWRLSCILRLSFNLLCLFLLTLIIDVMIYGQWVSLAVLQTGQLFGGSF